MPNLDNIRKTQERREARQKNKAQHVEDADTQEKELAALSDRLRGVAKSSPDDDATLTQETTTKAKAVGKRANKKQAQEAAEKQADEDLKNTVARDDPDEPIDLSQYAAAGREPPLHVLNKLAARADQAVRDEARDVAQAVGKLTYAELSGRAPERSRYSRNRKLAENISEMQRLRNAQTKTE